MVVQKEIILESMGRGFHLVTRQIVSQLPGLPEQGVVHIFLKHTSAALAINENADPSVRIDFSKFSDHFAPDGASWMEHTIEGADDMPAHVKSSLFGQSLTVPITNHQLNFGTWQGIYLCEFRNSGGPRTIVITILS
jgi:secondary thiamine-phosphate synthase enzyme